MKKSDSSNNENKKSDEWKSQPPEDVLFHYLHEIRNPVSLMKGWVGILSNEEVKELHPKALDSISKCLERIEEVNERLTDYAGELRRKKYQ